MSIATPGCGGGGDAGIAPPPPVVNQSPGGVWNGTAANFGDKVYGLVSEAGTFFLTTDDGAMYVGTLMTQANLTNGDMVAVQPPNGIFPDRATSGTGTVGGTIVERVSINGDLVVNTDPATSIVGGQTFSSSLSLTFDAQYSRASSLATLAGNFSFGAGGMLNISSAGLVSGQDTSGCTVNGIVSTIDPKYNMYDTNLTFSACAGIPDGVELAGLATLDDSQSPELLVLGVSNVASPTRFAILMRQARM
jgi:hypothetical protein